MIVAPVVLSIFLQLFVQAAQPWKALDPEQALYVYKRCYEDHLPAGSSRVTYLKSWNAWKLEPNDAVTHCYAKCVLIGLQIYEEKDNAFKSERIPVQHEAYKTLNEANPREVTEYQQALASINAGDGSCVALYNAYLPVHNKFVDLSRKLYHGTVEGAAKIYAAMPQIKQKGESFFAYCAKKIWGGYNKKEWKRGRNYELSGSSQFKKVIDCIFRGLRYMDDSGLKVDEVVRDFNLINKSDLEPEVRSVLASCTGTQAYDYYSCLLNSPVKEDFKKAFDFHELRSADYAFLLRGKVYEGPEQVKEEMKHLNTTVHF
uniref:Long form D7 salivary protein n=1 Tax=Anopheles quadriannulatus TaxID=34691 RepID=A0A1I8JW86_ANOQN